MCVLLDTIVRRAHLHPTSALQALSWGIRELHLQTPVSRVPPECTVTPLPCLPLQASVLLSFTVRGVNLSLNPQSTCALSGFIVLLVLPPLFIVSQAPTNLMQVKPCVNSALLGSLCK